MQDTSSGERVNILVVDDRPENVLALAAVLSEPHYDVITAGSGAEALRQLLKRDFAVILLDVLMPSMDGFETARLIFQREASRHIPIIFLTAAGSDVASLYKGYSLGAVDYLIKPIEPDIVRAKVAVFVDLFRKSRRIQKQEEALREAERTRSDRTLRETEAEYEATFEKAATGIAHVSPDGRWLRVNERLCGILGYTRQEALASKYQDVCHPEDVAKHVTLLHKILSGELPSYRGEERFVHRNGSVVWVDLTIALLRDHDGQPKKFITVVEDATLRKHAEAGQRALALASEALLNSLDSGETLDRVASTVVPTIADYCVIELVGEDVATSRPDSAVAHADPARAAALKELRTGRPRSSNGCVATVLATKSAQLIPVVDERHLSSWASDAADLVRMRELGMRSIVAAPLTVRGVVLGVITFVSTTPGRSYGPNDLALVEEFAHRAALGVENARLYKEARDAIDARDEFLSIASHELRTPLTPLQLQLQRLLAGRGKDTLDEMPRSQLRSILQRSSVQVGRLAGLIDSLLDVSRIGGGRLTLEIERVDAGRLVREIVSRFGELAEDGTARVTLSADGPALCSCDPLRFEQILSNLLANAIKYGNDKPVDVRVDSDGKTLTLVVKDRGIGIAEEKLSVIFDRFERGGADRSYGGLGLGLYITRKLVEAHGGKIRVASTPGAGSVFTVELPVEQVGPISATVPVVRTELVEPVRPYSPIHAKSILLVEDDTEIRECVAELLESHGYIVAATRNGREALQHLQDKVSRPEIILLDLMMPVMDGLEFREEQRKTPSIAGIPVVIVSGDGKTRERARSIGAAGFLKKPLDANELLKLIDKVVRESGAVALSV